MSRNGGSFIYILDAANGDSLGKLDNRNVSGGTYHVSDVGVSDDGIIYVCNLAVAGTFKVYKWAAETDTSLVAFTYDATGKRLGDKMTVTGSASDNSLVIWAASANSNFVVKFTTSDNGATFTPTVLDIGITGGSASVGPLPDASFYWNAGGNSVKKFTAAGVVVGTVPGSVVATGSNAIRLLTTVGSDELFATFQYGANNENARVVMVPNGDVTMATSYGLTTTLGTNANANGTGDVAVQNLGGGVFRVYVLSTNNGFGAYDVNTNYMRGTFYVGAAGTGPAGANPDFASLKAAFDLLNVKIIAGNCTFYITSNIDEPCIGAGLGLAVDPTPHSIVFKPYMGVSPVITLAYPADANEGPSGAFVIGIPDLGTAGHRINWPDIRPTRNIIIDGSNTEGGTTRDLTIQNATTAHRNGIPMVIVGDAQNITIKNTNLLYKPVVVSTSGGLFIGAVMIRARYDFIPKNLLFENNLLSANFDGVPQNGQGIGTYCASSTLPTGDFPNAITIKNNLIEGKRRAIGLNYSGSTDILNNEIILNQNIADGLTNEAIFAYNVKAGAIINIKNNKITKVSSKNSTANTTGNTGISIETAGTYNIFNNMITGFELTAANPSAYLYGVKISSAAAAMNLYHNTLLMNDLADVGTGVVKYYGIHIADGANAVMNNIVVNNEDNFASYNFFRTGTAGTIVSDYNDLYRSGIVNAKTGSLNGADAASMADWQTASGLDANSVAKMVEFVSASDLHLAGASVGDLDLAGTPLAEVTTDIDGEPRSIANPYMGADEGAVELKPIVILTLAEARLDADGDFYPDLKGDTVTVKGIVGSPNYGSKCQYYFQDETAGMVLFSSSIAIALNIGDEIQAKGVVDFYRGVTEIVPFAASDVIVLSTGNVIQPKKIKVAEIGEPYEAQVVQVDSVWFIDLKQWPAETKNGSVYFTDGVDTTYIFIDKETDLDGWTPPTGMLTIIAEVDQYTSSATVYNDGYSLRGIVRENFIELIAPPPPPEKLFPLWAKTQAAGTFPAYISTSSYTRGMAYGNVNGADRVYVVTRLGEHRVVIHDALTGDSLGVIPKPPQAEGVGLFHLNAVDVSDDGMIFVSNMTLGSDAIHPFRVYSWKSETDVAATAISYDAALGRMGDMFSVYGKASDNTLKIFAAVASKNMFVKFTTSDNGVTFTPEVITLPSGSFNTQANIAETKDGLYFIKSYGRALVRFNPTTLAMDTVSTTVVGTGASKIKYFTEGDKEYLMAYYPDVPGAGGSELFTIIDITDGTKRAYVAYISPSIGKVANGNGAGSVDIKLLGDGKFLGFVLGTNNGVAAFSNDQNYVVANLDTLFYGNTPVLHNNPYGAGFIVGTNGYGDIGKYQRFDFKMGDGLFGFKYYFAYKEIVNDPDTLHLVVKKVDSNGAPGDLLASIVITTDVLDTTMMGNTFFLDAPIPVDTSVFIGFEWSTLADDQFALFADADGEGEKANRAWERFSDGNYNDFLTILNPSYSWGVDVDLWIAAYYKKGLPSDVDDSANETLPTTYAVKQNYPNPFNPSTFIELALPEKADVEIVVFNVLGQKVAEVFKGKVIAGQHRFLFDAKGLSSGIYFYHVKANHFKAVKKMTLMK
ncbi:T9SS type A sorting domain-containing protein [candidate division KSB1 bacterium]|nr:T9SS type A sorting domain-containing protein [candidate division KSB1 bacterium]